MADYSGDSDSDFEDPDSVEVPGGGIDLNSIKANIKPTEAFDTGLKLPMSCPPPLHFFNPGANMNQFMGIPPELLDTRTSQIYDDAEANEDEGMGVAETYANYMPAKLKIGKKHPDPVVESTSLSSVEPVDVWYKLKLPAQTIDTGALSALQLEAITYACQKHETLLPDGSRAGFLLGDGAGVGKGRTIAGIIFENYLKKRKKAVWVSVMNDLKVDAERDLRDVGASNIIVHHLNKFKYIKLNSEECGFVKKGVIFCTYTALIAKTNQSDRKFQTRLDQIIEWCEPNFNGVIVFDECHRAKNLWPGGSSKPTKTGMVVVELQKALPKARVVYASATGATEPRNMAYMVRLGMWGPGTPYADFQNFLGILQKRGVGAMEIVAMDMKLQGLYISRHLSFHGATFKIIEVALSRDFVHIYDYATKVWVETYKKFREAAILVGADKSLTVTMWSQFWSAHQRFFKYMCISAKVKRAVAIAREAIKCGKCVVIGLQSTGEARTLHQLEKDDGELSDFVSTAKGVLLSLVEKHFPAPDRSKTNRLLGINPGSSAASKRHADSLSDSKRSSKKHAGINTSYGYIGLFNEDIELDPDPVDAFEETVKMKENLLTKIHKLGELLPPNALDELIDELGGPENVAEMTGRKGRVIHSEGSFQYESRSESDTPMDHLNLVEKQRFMDGTKDVAIISEAASSGISLHSDKRAINKKCRIHITLELPWSADRAIQQFGRTHRSNQANAPEYILLISNLAGERRFASVVAKRLESLGALTQGDRRATESRDMSMFNIDNNYGRSAMDVTLRSILGYEPPLVPPPNDYLGDFNADMVDALRGVGLVLMENDAPPGTCPIEQDRKSLGKFLNRILGMPVNMQNALFEYFTDTMEAVIEQAKKMGHFDLGILDVAANEQNLKKTVVFKFLRKQVSGLTITSLSQVSAERGMCWEEALDKCLRTKESSEGFYTSVALRNDKREFILAVVDRDDSAPRGKGRDLYKIYKPNVGLQVKRETLKHIRKKFRKLDSDDAEDGWKQRYDAALTTCSHLYWTGFCRKQLGTCEVGRRRRTYNVLSGSVLSVWHIVENIVSSHARLQVVRLKTKNGEKIVGTLIPSSCFTTLYNALKQGAEKVDVEYFKN